KGAVMRPPKVVRYCPCMIVVTRGPVLEGAFQSGRSNVRLMRGPMMACSPGSTTSALSVCGAPPALKGHGPMDSGKAVATASRRQSEAYSVPPLLTKLCKFVAYSPPPALHVKKMTSNCDRRLGSARSPSKRLV